MAADLERQQMVASHTAGLVNLTAIHKDRLDTIVQEYDGQIKASTLE